MSTATNQRLEVCEVKAAAAGRWREILSRLGAVPDESLNGKPGPCPKCGGKDRFRFTDMDGHGSVICNQCARCGDGIASLQWMTGWDFGQTLDEVGGYLGLGNGHASAPPLDPLQRLARDKHAPEESLAVFGGKIQGDTVVFPAYDETGQRCNDFTIRPAGSEKERKGLFGKDRHAGLFWPHDEYDRPRFPRPGETWLVVEGVKDAAALHGEGYNAVGLNTCQLHGKYARLFRDVRVVAIPDRDDGGEKGAKITGSVLRGVVACYAVAHLPAEHRHSGGADVRDILQRNDGRSQLREAIDDAMRRCGGDADTTPAVTFGRLTCAELDALAINQKYLIEHVLADHQDGLLAGKFKCHKTHIGSAAAFAIATRTPFLGAFQVPQTRRVGYFCGEGGLQRLQAMARKLARYYGLDLAEIETLLWYSKVPQLKRVDHVDAFKQAIDQDKLDVVFIDPAYFALRGTGDQASNYLAMGETLSVVTGISQDMDVTCFVTTHNKRSQAREFSMPELDDISFPGFAEWARQWILMGHRKPWNPDTHESWLWLNVGGYEHCGTWAIDINEGPEFDRWHASIMPANEAKEGGTKERTTSQHRRQAEELAAMIDKIKDSFRAAGTRELTTRDLAVRVASDYRRQGFLDAIASMVQARELEAIKTLAKNNHEADGFRRLFPDEQE